MPLQYGTKRKIPPTKVLAGRGVLAYVDDVAIMVTDVDKWTDADVIQLLEESAFMVDENRDQGFCVQRPDRSMQLGYTRSGDACGRRQGCRRGLLQVIGKSCLIRRME